VAQVRLDAGGAALVVRRGPEKGRPGTKSARTGGADHPLQIDMQAGDEEIAGSRHIVECDTRAEGRARL
jgi:hypothetical protein